MLRDWRPPSQSGQSYSLCPSLQQLGLYSGEYCSTTVLYCTVHIIPSHHNPVNISNYKQLPTIGQGVTRENQCLPTTLFSEIRGELSRIDDINILVMIYTFQCHNLPSLLPPHLMTRPLLPSDLKFCFQVCIDFLLSGARELTNWTGNTHTTPCVRGGGGRYNVFILHFYPGYTRHSSLRTCKLASKSHINNHQTIYKIHILYRIYRVKRR